MTTPMPASAPGEEMTYWKHGWEKCKKNPAVPVGAAATTVALLGATASLRSGNRNSFQKFLRLRVAAQGITVVAMVAGAYYMAENGEFPRPAHVKPPSEPFRVPEEVDESEHLYPPRIKTKVSDFTKRVRDADDKSF